MSTGSGDGGQPIVARDYAEVEGRRDPYIAIWIGGNTIEAIIDTGPDVMLLPKDIVEQKHLDLGRPVNVEPVPFELADGSLILDDIYIIEVRVNGRTASAEAIVLDPTRIERLPLIKPPVIQPLVGRAVIDNFRVTLDGKKKRVLVYDP